MHLFNVEVANKYGVHAAIIINNMQFWINKNIANGKHYYNGRTWTYNSIKAFQELFPYMTKYQITSAIKKLENEGVLLSANYNKLGYDRTKWYAFYAEWEWVSSISRKPEMDTSKTRNGFTVFEQPIPDSKPDKNTDNKPYNRKKIKKLSDFDKFIKLLETLFSEKNIKTFKTKINTTVAKKEFDKNSDFEKIANEYTDYVKRNKNMAVRLNKYLIAYSEDNLNAIEYGQNAKTSKPRMGMKPLSNDMYISDDSLWE